MLIRCGIERESVGAAELPEPPAQCNGHVLADKLKSGRSPSMVQVDSSEVVEVSDSTRRNSTIAGAEKAFQDEAVETKPVIETKTLNSTMTATAQNIRDILVSKSQPMWDLTASEACLLPVIAALPAILCSRKPVTVDLNQYLSERTMP
jgi:hypothetical protein